MKMYRVIIMATMAIMIGIQASGKSSFCKSNLQGFTRINLDELNTRNRERIAIMEAIQIGADIVIDNMNPTKVDREKYISIAKNYGYEVTGYFMQSKLQDCIERNEQREGEAYIPIKAIASTSNKLEIPEYSEGFDRLFFVSISDDGFKIDEWRLE